jgi:hypothetical protein
MFAHDLRVKHHQPRDRQPWNYHHRNISTIGPPLSLSKAMRLKFCQPQKKIYPSFQKHFARYVILIK